MTRTQKTIDNVNKAYGVGIILGHQNWVRSAANEPHRICVGCKEVVATGHDPNEQEIADHIYDMLIEAGLVWKESPAGKADDKDDLVNGVLVWAILPTGKMDWIATNRGRKYIIKRTENWNFSLSVTSKDFEYHDIYLSAQEAVEAANRIEGEEQLRGIL